MKSACALDDERMFLEAIRTDLHDKNILEVGSGIGAFARFLFSSCCVASYLGTELAQDRISVAYADEFLMSKRVKFLHVDGFTLDWDQFDIVVANPPMIPGEIGFLIEGKNFWERIREKYITEGYSGVLYLHVFDFFLDCYQREAGLNVFNYFQASGIKLSVEKRWPREVGPQSAIRKWIDLGAPNCASIERVAYFKRKDYKVMSCVVSIQQKGEF